MAKSEEKIQKEIIYVAFQPMTESEMKFAFKEIDPDKLERFLITKQMDIKNQMMEVKDMEKVNYLRGRYEGLGEFHRMISRFAKVTQKEDMEKVKRNIPQLREDKRIYKGLIK